MYSYNTVRRMVPGLFAPKPSRNENLPYRICVPGHLIRDNSSHFFVRVISYLFSGHLVPSFINGFNSLVLVFYVQKFTLFYLLLCKKMIFDHVYIDIFYQSSFNRCLIMPSSSGMTTYRNRLRQFRTLIIRLESFCSHCLIVSAQLSEHFGPSLVSAAISFQLDPLTIPPSFFRESKALLASTVIFFEDTFCCSLSVFHFFGVFYDKINA